jgi:hypothetical protein
MDNSDDGFSDDGLDSLPAGTLFQLEQNAYQATQGVSGYKESLQTVGRTVPAYESPHDGSQFLQPPPVPDQELPREYGDLGIGDLDAQVYEQNGSLEEPVIQTRSVETPAHATSYRNEGPYRGEQSDSTREQQLQSSISAV